MGDGVSRTSIGRREPPRFRYAQVVRKQLLGERMMRVTLGGDDLDGLVIADPAASVRLLLPSPGATDLVMPIWNGNEFLLPNGTRPIIRTFTPRYFDPDAAELDLDMVIHDGGIASAWSISAEIGSVAAISGPGRGYTIDPAAAHFLLGGDETAIPAIGQLLEAIPQAIGIEVHIEVVDRAGVIPLPDHRGATLAWHESPAGRPPGDALAAAVESAEVDESTLVWCAGEAAAMHRIRTNLFRERELPRSQATVRGYWKVQRPAQ